MPIDPSIIRGLQPVQVESPINRMAQVLQIKGMQDEQALNSLKAQEYQRGVAAENAMNDAYKGALGADGSVDRNRMYQTLASGGYGSKIPGLQKQFMEIDAKQADIGKTKAEGEAKALEAATKRVDAWGQVMGYVRQNPTAENAIGAVQHLVNMGIIPADKAQTALDGVANDPQSIANWATRGFQASLKVKDQLPTFQTRNTGGTTDTLQIDPVTGKVGVASSVQNTQSPDNAATNARAAADAAASRAQAERHFQAGQNTPEYKQDAEGNYIALPKKPGAGPIVATPVVDASGKPVGAGTKLGEAAKKQITGIDSLSAAIQEYQNELKNWGAADTLSPNKRAAMGTKYNNMMLQAKEAYNLGVLNGPDYQILTSVVTDPTTLRGAVTSNEALSKQAGELDRLMQRTRAAVANQGKGTSAAPAPIPSAPTGGLTPEEQKELATLRKRFGR